MGTSRAASACTGRGGESSVEEAMRCGAGRGAQRPETPACAPSPQPSPLTAQGTRLVSGSGVRRAPAASDLDPSPCFSPALAPASGRAAQPAPEGAAGGWEGLSRTPGSQPELPLLETRHSHPSLPQNAVTSSWILFVPSDFSLKMIYLLLAAFQEGRLLPARGA